MTTFFMICLKSHKNQIFSDIYIKINGMIKLYNIYQQLCERVISPSTQFVQIAMTDVKTKLLNTNSKGLILDILNKNTYFLKNSISFNYNSPNEEIMYEEYAINGAITEAYGPIIIYFDKPTILDVIKQMKLGTLDYDKFTNFIKILITHELIHREQIKRMGAKGLVSILSRLTKSMNDIDKPGHEDDYNKAYVSEPIELMAFAKQSILEFVSEGLSTNDILSKLKTTKGIEELINISDSFYQIYQFFPQQTPTFKRLVKYMYEYLTKEN